MKKRQSKVQHQVVPSDIILLWGQKTWGANRSQELTGVTCLRLQLNGTRTSPSLFTYTTQIGDPKTLTKNDILLIRV